MKSKHNKECARDCSKININSHLVNLNKKYKQRWHPVGPFLGMGLILAFAVFLLPLFVFLVVFNKSYFWIRCQEKVPMDKYFRFDRHRKANLRLMDKIWCEYCEWANGSLEWGLAITNEIERRYCPIQNLEQPHCSKVKAWRKGFLSFDANPEAVREYYENSYMNESNSKEKKSDSFNKN